MANSQQHTIEIIFAGVDNFSDRASKISGAIGSIGNSAQDIVAPFVSVTDAILAVDAAILLVGAGVAKLRSDFDSATGKIEASLGVTADRAKELGEISKEVFAESVSGSIDDAVKAVSLIEQKFKDFDFNDEQIKEMAKNAFAFGDLWEADAEETLKTIKTLVSNFGISEDVAFDFLAKGFQDGLDSAGDFYDTVNEYSVQFASAGADAGQFFSVIKSGFQEGVLGTDKAGDAFKEFTLRIADWRDSSTEAFAAVNELGLDPQKLAGLDQIDAFQAIINELKKVEDASDQTRIGALLIGTQFEDLKKSALAIDTATVKMEELAGSADKVQQQYTSLGATLTKVWRGVSAEIATLDAFESIEKDAIDFFSRLAGELPKAIANADYSGIIKSIEKATGGGNDLLLALGIDLTSPEGIQAAIQKLIDSVSGIIDITNGIAESFKPVLSAIDTLISYFNSLDSETLETLGVLLGVATQFSVIVGTITGLSSALGFVGASFGGLATAASVAAVPIAAVASAMTGVLYFTNDTARAEIDKTAQSFLSWADSILDFSGTAGDAGKAIDSTTEKLIAEAKAMQDARKATDETADSLKGLSETPAIVDIEINKQSLPQQLADIQSEISSLEQTKIELEAKLTDATGPEREKILGSIFDIEQAISQASGKEIALTSEIDTKNTEDFLKDPDSFLSIEKSPIVLDANVKKEEAKKQVEELIVEVGGKTFVLEATIDKDNAKKTKEELEKIVPPEKQLKILADLDIAKFQEQTKQFDSVQETIQKKLQFKAELNIAEVEANVKILEGSMENINTLFSESGSIISDAFGLLGGLDFGSAGQLDIFRLVKEQIREQNDLQREALELQKEITLSQIKLNEAKQKALLAGEPLVNISIDGSNMEYELRAMALAFIRFAQIEATNEGLESLLEI